MSQNAEQYVREQNARPVPAIVYHASRSVGLKELVPNKSTHRQAWVYASDDEAIAAIFISRERGDLSCSSGISNGEVYIYERWKGAFNSRYRGKRGAVYELLGKTFQRGRTSFTGDLISEVGVPVLRERIVEDASLYLIELKEAGRIRIFMHDERPYWIPENDQDLVDGILRWSRGSPNPNLLSYAEGHLPHLVDRIREGWKTSERE